MLRGASHGHFCAFIVNTVGEYRAVTLGAVGRLQPHSSMHVSIGRWLQTTYLHYITGLSKQCPSLLTVCLYRSERVPVSLRRSAMVASLRRACCCSRFLQPSSCLPRNIRVYSSADYEKPDVRKLAKMAQLHVTDEEVQLFQCKAACRSSWNSSDVSFS